jgi:hypothetical protein
MKTPSDSGVSSEAVDVPAPVMRVLVLDRHRRVP